MRKFLAFLCPFLAAFGSPSPGQQISGTVRIIRSHPETEVFFKDLKESVIIPKDSKHNQVYKACEESQKTGSPVSLIIDPVSRRVLSLPESTATQAQPPASSDSALEDASVAPAKKSGNKEAATQ